MKSKLDFSESLELCLMELNYRNKTIDITNNSDNITAVNTSKQYYGKLFDPKDLVK